MSGLVVRIREQGISLGGPNRKLIAKFDFLRLNKKVEEGSVLVAVYESTQLGVSASPCDNLDTFRMIRRSPVVEVIEYYAVKKELIGG